MSDYAETCSMCGQIYSHGLDQEHEIEKLRKLVKAAYSEGFTDGMGNMPEGDAWQDSQTRSCLEYGFDGEKQ